MAVHFGASMRYTRLYGTDSGIAVSAFRQDLSGRTFAVQLHDYRQ